MRVRESDFLPWLDSFFLSFPARATNKGKQSKRNCLLLYRLKCLFYSSFSSMSSDFFSTSPSIKKVVQAKNAQDMPYPGQILMERVSVYRL